MKLKDCIQNTIAGDWGDEKWSDESSIKVHCLRSADIVPIYQHNYKNIPYRYVSRASFEKRNLKEGDIVIEKSGGTNSCSTGRPILISKELLRNNTPLMSSNFCCTIRLKQEWHSEYVYYYLKLLHKSGVFFNYEGKTSGIHNLDMDAAFSAIEIPNISLESQKKIANVLCKIEEKIILNTKINCDLSTYIKEKAA